MSAPTSDDEMIAELLPVFIQEAREQIVALEELLLQLEDAPGDGELLDALFRCAHTIKGSAGVFGLSAVVNFTHHVETLLSRLRDGHLQLTAALSTLLLESNDVIRALVDDAQDGRRDTPEAAASREQIVQRLREATQDPQAAPSVEAPPPIAVPATCRWHLSVQFGLDTFVHGMNPVAILQYVGRLGRIPSIVCDHRAVPLLDALDSEKCHLAFELSLDTAAPREEIEQAFSFVREDSTLNIIGPGADPRDFVALIASMPDKPRLGEILVSAGAITQSQLELGLRSQALASATADSPPRLGELLQATTGVSPDVVAAALEKQQRQRTASDDSSVIRIQAGRLDEVIDLLGELVIAGAGATLLARQTRDRTLIEANSRITRLIEGIRNSTLKMRMVPIGETFARFRRVVRDTAAELGKEVALEVVGGDTELDKAMVERIADPLMHLVRNALDHGLETPAERQAAGKVEQGRLTLAACHESGHIVIRITDDGRGIQRDKVLQRARERGLVNPTTVPADDELLRLIFEPGFSTAEKVTNLSGRGVGMDVVRRNIEALRGTIDLSSTTGQGSCIEIRLPLTLAIIDGFLLGVGASKFILPLDAVAEVIADRPSAGSVDHRGRSCVELRGQLLPVANLRTLYALDSPQPARSSIVVVRAGARRFGVMVDVLLGQHQTVIKPLGPMLRSLRGVSGSSILGSGEVALIFDAGALGQLADGSRQAGARHASPPRDLARSPSSPLTTEQS